MPADIHSMRWPLGEPETDFLRELGDRGAPFRGDRRIVLPRRAPVACVTSPSHALPLPIQPRHQTYLGAGACLHLREELGYVHTLPFAFDSADPGLQQDVNIYVGAWRAELAEASVRLALSVKEMVAADTLSLTLNGVSLDEEPRSYTPRNGNRGRLHVSGTCESDHCVSCMCSSAA